MASDIENDDKVVTPDNIIPFKATPQQQSVKDYGFASLVDNNGFVHETVGDLENFELEYGENGDLAHLNSIGRTGEGTDISKPEEEEAAQLIDKLSNAKEHTRKNGKIEFSADLVNDYGNLDTMPDSISSVEIVRDGNYQAVIDRLFNSGHQVMGRVSSEKKHVLMFTLPPVGSDDHKELTAVLLNTVDGRAASLSATTMLVIDTNGRAALIDSVDERFELTNPSLGESKTIEDMVDSNATKKEMINEEVLNIEEDEILKAFNAEIASITAIMTANKGDPGEADKDENKKKTEGQGGGFSLFGGSKSNHENASVKLANQLASAQSNLRGRTTELVNQVAKAEKRAQSDAAVKRHRFLNDGIQKKQLMQNLNKQDKKYIKELLGSPVLQMAFISTITDKSVRLANELNRYETIQNGPKNSKSEPKLRKCSQNIDDLFHGPAGLARQMLIIDALQKKGGLKDFGKVPGATEKLSEFSLSMDALRRHKLASNFSLAGVSLANTALLKSLSAAASDLKAALVDGLQNIAGVWKNTKG
jgi:hypothetical protein